MKLTTPIGLLHQGDAPAKAAKSVTPAISNRYALLGQTLCHYLL